MTHVTPEAVTYGRSIHGIGTETGFFMQNLHFQGLTDQNRQDRVVYRIHFADQGVGG
jgi:hypothetical protein